MFYKCHLYEFFWLVFRYKFDDERVTKEDIKKALEEQYGGEEEVTFYMTNVHSVQCITCGLGLTFFFVWNSCLK